MAQQGSPPRRSLRQPAAGPAEADYPADGDYKAEPGRARTAQPRRERAERPDRAGWQEPNAFGADEDVPEWAGPAVYPRRPENRRRPLGDPYAEPDDGADPAGSYQDRPGGPAGQPAEPAPRRASRRGRAAATRLRKSRRRVYRWAGLAIVVCVLAAGISALVTHHPPKPALYVTTLLPGEFKSVPAACSSVSAAVLSQNLPGPGRTTTSELSGGSDSECSFTVDRKPVFLVLEVSAQAYQPFAAATGSGSAAGSASANAEDNFALVQAGLTHPPKQSPVAAAQVTALPGVGQQAIVAIAAEHVKGITTQVTTVVIRERNVVITVSESGQESGHGFGPVPVATLKSGAIAAAKDVLAKTLTQPKAG